MPERLKQENAPILSFSMRIRSKTSRIRVESLRFIYRVSPSTGGKAKKYESKVWRVSDSTRGLGTPSDRSLLRTVTTGGLGFRRQQITDNTVIRYLRED